MAITKLMMLTKTPKNPNTMPKARLIVLGGAGVVVVVVLPAKQFSIFFFY